MEGRGPAKGNLGRQNAIRTQSRVVAPSELAHGDTNVVRYADDIVVGFEFEDEAERFRAERKERMRKFQLELHPEKTRLIEFGRHAAKNRKRAGLGKPETFSFPTHTRQEHFPLDASLFYELSFSNFPLLYSSRSGVVCPYFSPCEA